MGIQASMAQRRGIRPKKIIRRFNVSETASGLNRHSALLRLPTKKATASGICRAVSVAFLSETVCITKPANRRWMTELAPKFWAVY
jgi:hypothetical protein